MGVGDDKSPVPQGEVADATSHGIGLDAASSDDVRDRTRHGRGVLPPDQRDGLGQRCCPQDGDPPGLIRTSAQIRGGGLLQGTTEAAFQVTGPSPPGSLSPATSRSPRTDPRSRSTSTARWTWQPVSSQRPETCARPPASSTVRPARSPLQECRTSSTRQAASPRRYPARSAWTWAGTAPVGLWTWTVRFRHRREGFSASDSGPSRRMGGLTAPTTPLHGHGPKLAPSGLTQLPSRTRGGAQSRDRQAALRRTAGARFAPDRLTLRSCTGRDAGRTRPIPLGSVAAPTGGSPTARARIAPAESRGRTVSVPLRVPQ